MISIEIGARRVVSPYSLALMAFTGLHSIARVHFDQVKNAASDTGRFSEKRPLVVSINHCDPHEERAVRRSALEATHAVAKKRCPHETK